MEEFLHQLRLVVTFIPFFIPGGAAFLPSTVAINGMIGKNNTHLSGKSYLVAICSCNYCLFVLLYTLFCH